ncbi:unnamed protein product, partial [Owenia fusiformis]
IIGSIVMFTSATLSPLSFLIIQSLGTNGYRIGSMIGITLKSLSFLCSSFISSIDWLFLTHSIIGGMANSILLVAVSNILGEHFHQQHRFHVFATSVLSISFPLGGLIFNPMNTRLVLNYGWRGTFRISSAFTFVIGMICSSLLFPYKRDLVDSGSNKDASVEMKTRSDDMYSSIDGTKADTVELKDVESIENDARDTTKLIPASAKDKMKCVKKTKTDIKNSDSRKDLPQTEETPLFTKKETSPGEDKSTKKTHDDITNEKSRKEISEPERTPLFISLETIVTYPETVLWIIGIGMTRGLLRLPYLNMAIYLDNKGISRMDASYILMVLSIAEGITYIIAAALGDCCKGRLIYTHLTATLGMSLLNLAWQFIDVNYTAIMVLAIINGGLLALTTVYLYSCTCEVLQHLSNKLAFNQTLAWVGIPVSVVPPIFGKSHI